MAEGGKWVPEGIEARAGVGEGRREEVEEEEGEAGTA